MRTPFVVDTNVLCLANGSSSYSSDCETACARKLREIQLSGTVVVDSSYSILKEYKAADKNSGQPGLGAAFLRWLYTSRHYIQVRITQHDSLVFAEFPSHQGLRSFDRSDRKFIAVAVAHGSCPPIIQAADSKWWGWQAALTECGLVIEFLCPEEIAAKHKKKIGV